MEGQEVGEPSTVNATADPMDTLSTSEEIFTTPRTESASYDFTRLNRGAPLPGRIYKIISVSCGRQIMILNGQVMLASPEELGSPYWACEQHDTWLSFRNPATGKLLGHDSGNPGLIRCDAQNRLQWEQMLAIPHTRTKGAFSILTEYWYGRRSIGLYEVEGGTRLCRIVEGHDPGVAWVFSEVSATQPDT